VEENKLYLWRHTRERVHQVVGVAPDAGKVILDVATVNGK
jgi:hypothetical protein